MTIEAKIIADSISEAGARITTLELKYPRFIHSEFMTHRVFSRSASSSRAIPVAKMLDQVRNNPATPIHWGKNQPGMQAREELEQPHLDMCKGGWVVAANEMANIVEGLLKEGLHKQVANRLLEPFQHISVVVTSTEWDNFFELRDHPSAQPEMQELAKVMMAARNGSIPELLYQGAWHLPYVGHLEREDYPVGTAAKISAARCARVSYLTHNGEKPNFVDDLALFEKLAGSVPSHASPLEHQATPCRSAEVWSGNFRGWLQFRQEYFNVPPYFKTEAP